MPSETPRDRVLRLWGDIKREREVWMGPWRDAVDYVLPWRGRFFPQKWRPEGDREFGADIVNMVATRSVSTGASGMMSSSSNPARPWFRLTTATPSLAEVGSVRQYLDQVQRLLDWIFSRSNIYNALHVAYRDLLALGTAPLYVDEDPQTVLRAYVLPVGQYGLACDATQRVDTCGRELTLTARQVVQRFGTDTVSRRVLNLVRDGNLNQPVEILHFIAPNEDLRVGTLGPAGKPWLSMWLDRQADAKDPPFLAVKGYNQFPVMAARWEVTGTEDVYGHAPLREVMGDVKQLQHVDTKKIELIDKVLTPPIEAPQGVDYPSMLAGATNVLPAGATGGSVKAIHAPSDGSILQARAAVAELMQQIRQGLHEDLWRILVDRPDPMQPNKLGPDRTAYEIAARESEKLTLVGPAIQRLHDELFSPLIRRAIAILAERGELPPPPRQLVEALVAGDDVRIEYISVMAQAQRLLGLGSLERFGSIVRALAPDPADPLWDKVDRDEFVDQVADALGTPPSVVRSDDAVVEMRLARARQARQAAEAAQLQIEARAARELGQTPASGDTALSRILATQYGPAAAGALPREALA